MMANNLYKGISFRRILEWQLQHPRLVITGVIVITLMFAWCIPNLSFKTSIYDLIIEDLPETARYEEFKEIFGSDEIIQVVIKAENVFEAATFKKIQALSEEAAGIAGVRRVISLPEVKQAVDLSGNWDLARLQEVLSGVDLFKRNLFSKDGRSTALTLVLTTEADSNAVIAAVNRMIDTAPDTLSLYQIGMPLVSQALAYLTQKDFFRLPPITFILIAVILLVIYKNVLHLILPLMCVSFALVWNFGLMAVAGIKLSMLTMIVPVFLIAVGTAYCLHIISEYRMVSRQAESPRDAASATFTRITFPTVLAVFTTLVGLFSLLINRITAIREFAIFACVGILSLLIIAITLFPAVMAMIPLPKKKENIAFPHTGLLDRLIDKIADLNLNHQKITLPIIGALVVFCIIGIFKIPVESNPVGYFKENTEISRNFHDIYKHLSGAFPINVVMGGPKSDFFEDADRIAEIAKIQKFMETLPGVDKTISFADYLMLVNYASNRFEPEFYRLPKESWELRMLINSYRTLLGEDMLTRFMSPDFSKANILVLTHISSSREFLKTRKKIIDFAGKTFSKDITWQATGFGMVISESSHQLTSGQIKSLSITMVIIFGLMFTLFLSGKVGLISIVPNLFPIIVNFGIMGWLGVELSMFTSLIASIAIGLAVDDTIHYLVRYNQEFRKDLNDRRALRETLRHIGRPIIFTTLTISIGFSILTLSSFKPTAIFGTMMAVTMVSALVGDLILLPSLLRHVELVTLWDLVRLKLGKDPGVGIPLFSGLSRTQIHYIIMAGTLKKINSGEVLFHKGASSDSMCAIISGAMDVVELENTNEPAKALGVYRQLNRAGAGDILGEMGLLRNMPRSATVIAAEPSEYLEINLKMIRRLQWLYPPTANRFFMNLMTILCNRIELLSNNFSCESIKDDLTGWYNRKGFTGVLETELNRARRYGKTLSLCLMGIDLEVADMKMSYEIKDRSLRMIGQTLSRLIRKCDSLGRLDAETFALLMPETSAAQAEPVCSRLRNLLLEKRMDVDGIRMKVVLSIVEMAHHADETAEEMLNRFEKNVAGTRKNSGLLAL
jgi:diguanylate cyclase (GGDEF)-like protein